jgi:hypothetical protein
MQSKPSPAQLQTKADVGPPSAFPYDLYKGTKVWEIVDKAIEDLANNHDIAETTRRDYIVGYICKQLERL